MTTFLDVTTLMRWGRVVGIVRCELELAQRFLDNPGVGFVEFVGSSGNFVLVRGDEVKNRIELLRSGKFLSKGNEVVSEGALKQRPNLKEKLKKFAFSKQGASRLFVASSFLLSHWFLTVPIEIIRALGAKTRVLVRDLRHELKVSRRSIKIRTGPSRSGISRLKMGLLTGGARKSGVASLDETIPSSRLA